MREFFKKNILWILIVLVLSAFLLYAFLRPHSEGGSDQRMDDLNDTIATLDETIEQLRGELEAEREISRGLKAERDTINRLYTELRAATIRERQDVTAANETLKKAIESSGRLRKILEKVGN